MNKVKLIGEIVYINDFEALKAIQFNLKVNRNIINCLCFIKTLKEIELKLNDIVEIVGEIGTHKRNTEIRVKQIRKLND